MQKALKDQIGKKGELTIGSETTEVGLTPIKKKRIGFMTWTIFNTERPTREALHARLRTLEQHRVFSEIAAQMSDETGYAKCTQAQLALELSMNKSNISHAVKYLTTRPADATNDPLTQELVRRVPGGFIVNPQFAIVGAHERAWEVWFRNAPDTSLMGSSDQEIAAAKRIEARADMAAKKAKYLRDKGEIRADRKKRAITSPQDMREAA